MSLDDAVTTPLKIVHADGRRARLTYRFTNRQATRTGLWIALPPTIPGTQVVGEIDVGPDAAVRYRGPDRLGINELVHVELAPGDTAHLCAEVVTSVRSLEAGASSNGGDVVPTELTDAEREVFLRSSPLIPVDDALRAEAQAIVAAAGATGTMEIARALFDELAGSGYTYRFPPKDRGARQMSENRRGDCGEFAFLFAAWCRSLAIPCRVAFGTFAKGFMRGHAWNEFHVDGVGWVPADPSMARVARSRFWRPSAVGLPARPDAYFGSLDAARIVFSWDPDVPILQPVTKPPVEGPSKSFRLNGEHHRWGIDTRDGLAPYLQPAYPSFEEPAHRRQALIGRWRVQEDGVRGWLDRAAGVALLLVAASFLLDVMQGLDILPDVVGYITRPLGSIAFAVWSIALVLRREMLLIILPIWGLLGLAVAAAIIGTAGG